MYGTLFRDTDPLGVFNLDDSSLVTTTFSVDGFTGLTVASIRAAWSSQDGETHVLDAEVTLRAMMSDARAEL
jgi:hypothetical protein